MCRLSDSGTPYRRVTKVELVGPPSFVYGLVVLHFEDGGVLNLVRPGHHRPAKSWVEVSP